MKKCCFLAIISLLFAMPSPCRSEIEEVIIKWDPLLCKQACIKGLEKRFGQVPGVQSVEMNRAEGSSKMSWKPNVPFAFTPLNAALRWIGIRQNDVRVKVRGTVSESGNAFFLISNGDRTKFVLINRVYSDPGEYVVQFNTQNREIKGELAKTLREVKKAKDIVSINGTLFMPLRSPPNPLYLIVDQIQKEQPEQAPANKQKRPR